MSEGYTYHGELHGIPMFSHPSIPIGVIYFGKAPPDMLGMRDTTGESVGGEGDPPILRNRFCGSYSRSVLVSRVGIESLRRQSDERSRPGPIEPPELGDEHGLSP